MLRHFLEYEKIQEGFDGDTGDTGATGETETEEINNDYYNFFKNFGLTVVFYLLFVFLFVIGGSVLLKFFILSKSLALPTNLDYRDKEYLGDGSTAGELYNKFFEGNQEKLKNDFFVAKSFKFDFEENGTKKNIFLPLYLSYKYYYNDTWLVRCGKNSGSKAYDGNVYTIEDDIQGKTDELGMNENFPLLFMNYMRWFLVLYTGAYLNVNYCLNYLFNFIPIWGAIVVSVAYALSSVISLIESTTNNGIQNISGKILTPILTSSFIPTLITLVTVFTYVSLFYNWQLLVLTHDSMEGQYLPNIQWHSAHSEVITGPVLEQQNVRIFLYNSFNDGMVVARCFVGAIIFIICLWVAVIFAIFITLSSYYSKIFGSSGCFKIGGEWQQFTLWNTIKWLLPIFCFTRWTMILLLLLPLVIISAFMDQSLPLPVGVCLFVCLLWFRKSIQTLKDSYLKLIGGAQAELEKTTPEMETNAASPADDEDMCKHMDDATVDLNKALKQGSQKAKLEKRLQEQKDSSSKNPDKSLPVPGPTAPRLPTGPSIPVDPTSVAIGAVAMI